VVAGERDRRLAATTGRADDRFARRAHAESVRKPAATLLALGALALVPAVALGAGHPGGGGGGGDAGTPPPSGTLSICSASGLPAVAGPLAFTVAAPASAGGSQVLTVAVGACSTQIFYPLGVSVVVTESIPSGEALAGITLAGGGSAIASSNLASGTATVQIGTGQSTLTFKTNGPVVAPQPRPCKVPNVVGFGLTGARIAIKKAACTMGIVHRVYSNVFQTGRVVVAKPHRGTVLAHLAPVAIYLSRGPRG
jgi:hypothetical protein